MDLNLKAGLTGKAEMKVSYEDTARAVGSGSAEVLATPKMIALLEQAAVSAVDPLLPEGLATVGTFLQVSHVAATPMGMQVHATAELLKWEGRKLIFKVEAFDEVEKVGEGIHERFVIDRRRFLEKVQGKKSGL